MDDSISESGPITSIDSEGYATSDFKGFTVKTQPTNGIGTITDPYRPVHGSRLEDVVNFFYEMALWESNFLGESEEMGKISFTFNENIVTLQPSASESIIISQMTETALSPKTLKGLIEKILPKNKR